MFSPLADLARPAARSVRIQIRAAADLAIAFVTLESYGLDDLRHACSSSAPSRFGATTGDATPAPSIRTPRRATARVEHAMDARRPAPRDHARARRPGAIARRTQLCLAPVEQTPGAGAAAPRRRTAPRGASR